MIPKQNTVSDGDYGAALYEVLNNLKEIVVDNGRYILRFCNEDKKTYPDIYPKELKIPEVAVCVMRRLNKRRQLMPQKYDLLNQFKKSARRYSNEEECLKRL